MKAHSQLVQNLPPVHDETISPRLKFPLVPYRQGWADSSVRRATIYGNQSAKNINFRLLVRTITFLVSKRLSYHPSEDPGALTFAFRAVIRSCSRSVRMAP